MKKIRWYIISIIILVLSTPMVVKAANACSATIDKNGYCDETGEYHDPSISTIKNNNCTTYKKDIVKGYCSTICREDATTKFPNKVPMVSVDQYDTILGGSHFIWEEIATTRVRECETTIKWDKWKKEWEKVTGTQSGQPNGNGIAELVLHIAREDHQRNSDVNVCDVITGSRSGWTEKQIRFYSRYDKATYPRAIMKLEEWKVNDVGGGTSKDELLAYYGCIKGKGSKTEYVNGIGNKWYSIDMNSNDPRGDCTDQLTSSQKRKYVYADTYISTSGACSDDYTGSTCSRARICRYSYCEDGSKPDSNGKCPPRSKKCGSKKERIWSKVNFDSLKAGIASADYQRACEGEIKYNSVDYDKDLSDYKVEGAKDEGVGGNGYRLSLNEMKNEIKRLESILRTCNSSGNSANNQTDSSNITVNYMDNPTKAYKRNVELKKTRVGKQKVTGYTTKASNPTIYTSTCTTVSASKLQKLVSINDLPSILGSTTCKKKEYTAMSNYANTTIYSKVEEKFQYKMPENTYRYIQKTDGKSVDRVTGSIAANKSYIDKGYPNYPVSFNTPTGTYPISLTYNNIGINGHFVKNATYSCVYKVINRIIPCVGKDCDNTDCTGDKCDRRPDLKGINVIYRPISLTNPFPGESGTGRTAGTNWSKKDITDYITNNRKAKQNEVYNRTPLYSFTLTASSIKQIKAYNSRTTYDDFKLKCAQPYGKRCMSDFLKSIRNYGVTVNGGKCYNVGTGSFYSCADKPNQDNIKCYWKSKDKKLQCVNCSIGQGHENDAICKEGSGK